MSTDCIHGFPAQQCASCRTCAHGQVTASCTRCRATTTARSRSASIAADPERPSEAHAGFEIFYEPAVTGWRYRAEGAEPVRVDREAIAALGVRVHEAPLLEERPRGELRHDAGRLARAVLALAGERAS